MANNVTKKPKVCTVCEKAYYPTSNRQKYCTKDCEKVVTRQKQHEHHIKRYKRKGYNQKGPNCNNWKGGINNAYYQRIAFEHYPKVCQRCKDTKNIVVHHKDRNRYNNDVSNLEVLCRKCHTKEHKLVENNFDPYRKLTALKLCAYNALRKTQKKEQSAMVSVKRYSQRP